MLTPCALRGEPYANRERKLVLIFGSTQVLREEMFGGRSQMKQLRAGPIVERRRGAQGKVNETRWLLRATLLAMLHGWDSFVITAGTAAATLMELLLRTGYRWKD